MSNGKDYTNVKEENQARAQNRTIFQFPSIPKCLRKGRLRKAVVSWDTRHFESRDDKL